jgi:hypothetical protein
VCSIGNDSKSIKNVRRNRMRVDTENEKLTVGVTSQPTMVFLDIEKRSTEKT